MNIIKVFLIFYLLTHHSIHSQTRYDVIDLCGAAGGSYVFAMGINDSGYVVGWLTITGAEAIAFRYKDGLTVNLGHLGYYAVAYAINIHGNVVGESMMDMMGPRHAFLHINGSMIDIGAFSGDRDSYATNINNNNTVVGYYYGENQGEVFGFIYNNGSVVTLESGNSSTYANSINDSGYVVGASNTQAFLFHNGAMLGLGTMGGQTSNAWDINNKNQIVGYSSSGSDYHAFLYENGLTTDLGPGMAYAVNDSGLIVGYVQGSQGSRAMLWKDNQGFDLNQLIDPNSGWTLLQAKDINNRGEIIGTGIHGGTACAVLLKPGLEILEPKADDKWIAGEKDTIKWSGGKNQQVVAIEYSTDAGNTFLQFDFVASGDTGIYVWDIPPDILSKKCVIRILDFNDPLNTDTCDVFKIKPYILTRDSSGQYEPYRTEEDQWGFWNNPTGEDMFPQSWYQQFDYQGIDPFTNSNYSLWQGGYVFLWATSSDFPDWVSWVNTFGVNACYLSTTSGIYSPLAVLRWAAIKNNWIGSCFGIAASNALAFAYKGQFQTKYNNIFPAFANPNTVSSDNGVKKVVNELFTHQFGNPSKDVRNTNLNKITPNQTLNQLKEMLKEDNVSPKTLSIWNNNGKGGHNILPYKLQQDIANKHIFYLYVYDNSYPAVVPAVIKIDTLGNSFNGTWTPLYGWANWGGPKYLMLENESIDYFNNATLPKRTEGSASPFILSSDELEIYTQIDANTIIKDALGNVTGLINDSVLIDIPNSIPMFYLDGSESPPYGYSLPTDNYSVLVDSFTTDTVKTFFFTGNRTFTYKRYDADQTQTDRFFFDGGVSVTNPDQQTKTISLLNIINETTQEKLFSFNSMELAQNDSVKIENPDSNKIKLKSFGTAKDYDIEINYVNENGMGRFGDFDVPLEANTSHTFVPNWTDITNTDLEVLVDIGNDGTIDDTLYLQNQVTGIGDDQGSLLTPTSYNLAQNFPNPFNPVTTIQYSIPQRSSVTLKVYDVLGNEVATLVDEYREAGRYEIEFDASSLSSGIYFYKLQAGNFTETKKMILIR